MSELNYRSAAEVWIDAMTEIADPPRGILLPWWPKLNDMLGGLRPSELTLLCAPTGSGKTQFLANISAQLLGQRVPHFVAPVETGDTDFIIRLASVLDKYDYNTGALVPPERLVKITERYSKLLKESCLFLSTYDNRVAIDEMIHVLKYMHEEYGVKVALLDNLNFFLNVVSNTMEKAEMDNAMHEFVMLAKKIPMHIILIVHPKKTEGGRVESEFDIKGSSTAVQEASNVVLYNRPKPGDARPNTDRELIFKKIRKRGFNVNRPIWLAYEEGRMKEESHAIIRSTRQN